MVEQQALAQTEDEMNLLTLRLENVSARFDKLEAEVCCRKVHLCPIVYNLPCFGNR